MAHPGSYAKSSLLDRFSVHSHEFLSNWKPETFKDFSGAHSSPRQLRMVPTHKANPPFSDSLCKTRKESQKTPQAPGGHCTLYAERYRIYLQAKTQTLSQSDTSIGETGIYVCV